MVRLNGVPFQPDRGWIFSCCPLVLQRQSRQSRTATGLCLRFFSISVCFSACQEAVPRSRATGWCFRWRLSARRWWLGSGACRCSAERAWFPRGTSWVRLHPQSRWMNRRNSLWHVSERAVKETTIRGGERKNRERDRLNFSYECEQKNNRSLRSKLECEQQQHQDKWKGYRFRWLLVWCRSPRHRLGEHSAKNKQTKSLNTNFFSNYLINRHIYI